MFVLRRSTLIYLKVKVISQKRKLLILSIRRVKSFNWSLWKILFAKIYNYKLRRKRKGKRRLSISFYTLLSWSRICFDWTSFVNENNDVEEIDSVWEFFFVDNVQDDVCSETLRSSSSSINKTSLSFDDDWLPIGSSSVEESFIELFNDKRTIGNGRIIAWDDDIWQWVNDFENINGDIWVSFEVISIGILIEFFDVRSQNEWCVDGSISIVLQKIYYQKETIFWLKFNLIILLWSCFGR